MTEAELTEEEFMAEMAALRTQFVECGFDPRLPKKNAPTSTMEH